MTDYSLKDWKEYECRDTRFHKACYRRIGDNVEMMFRAYDIYEPNKPLRYDILRLMPDAFIFKKKIHSSESTIRNDKGRLESYIDYTAQIKAPKHFISIRKQIPTDNVIVPYVKLEAGYYKISAKFEDGKVSTDIEELDDIPEWVQQC